METLMIIIRTAIYMPFLILAIIFMAIGTLISITLFILYYAGMPVIWVYDQIIKLLHKLTIL